MEKITLSFIINACGGELMTLTGREGLVTGESGSSADSVTGRHENAESTNDADRRHESADSTDGATGRLENAGGTDSCFVDAVCTDSREAAALTGEKHVLFVPIAGERVDAHRFLPDVAKAGITAAFVSKKWLASEAGKNFIDQTALSCAHTFHLIAVEDTLLALQQTAASYREQFSIPVIGITGSVGKTTTKEMVAAALETALRVHKTAGNQNSQIGLPLTIFGIGKDHEAAIIEMGMSEFGEMSRIAAVAKPDHAVMTNIGVAHIGNLGSQENIRSEKLHITDHFHAGSCLFANADDTLLADPSVRASLPEGSVCELYGTDEAALWRASDIQVTGEGQDFILHCPDSTTETVHLSVLGEHNVRNALAAFAVAGKLGISPAVAKEGLAAYKPLNMRGNLIEAGSLRILDDSYNASPDSMKSSLTVLSSLPDTECRIAVFADILELGERSAELHRSVGTFLAEHNTASTSPINYLITVGTESRHIAEGYRDSVRNCGFTDSDGAVNNAGETVFTTECRHFASNTEAADFLCSILQEGRRDAVLVKGSRGMKTDEIVAALTGRQAEH